MTLTATRPFARTSHAHPMLAHLRSIETTGDHGLEELHDTVLMSLIDVSTALFGTAADLLPTDWGFTAPLDAVANAGVALEADEIPLISQWLLEPDLKLGELLFVGHVLNRYLDLISEVY